MTAAKPLVIAVDGPAAAGKGTLARGLAAHFGLPHLDTGLLYRAAAARLLDAGGDPADEAAAAAAARALGPADAARGDLRRPGVDRASSIVSAHPGVRAALLDFQRRFAAERGAVLDGRDIGTVVLPDATVKLFVTADPVARAERRWRERMARGEATDFAATRAEMAERDARDAARDAAPLRPAEDAVLLDTTLLDAAAALAAAVTVVEARLAGRAAPPG